jgi:methylase of polypeptide subunit release factors
MGKAVVINLDYASLDEEQVRLAWQLIEQQMRQAGFTKESRLFIGPDDTASDNHATDLLQALEQQLQRYGLSTFDAIREFYSFDLESSKNWLLPPADHFEVRELNA